MQPNTVSFTMTGVDIDPPYPEDTPPRNLGISLGEMQGLPEWLFCPTEMQPAMFYVYNYALQNTPPGSLPNETIGISYLAGISSEDVVRWIFRGWTLATDGRLYHPTLVEIVKRDLRQREGNRQRAERYRSKQKGSKRIKNDPAVPYADIVAAYNEILGATNPECLQLNNTRRTRIKSLYKGDLTDLERWRQFFLYIAGIPFLTGRTSSKGGKPFRPGIDWLTKPENYLKIRERGYE